eukprot:UC4_evm2s506
MVSLIRARRRGTNPWLCGAAFLAERSSNTYSFNRGSESENEIFRQDEYRELQAQSPEELNALSWYNMDPRGASDPYAEQNGAHQVMDTSKLSNQPPPSAPRAIDKLPSPAPKLELLHPPPKVLHKEVTTSSKCKFTGPHMGFIGGCSMDCAGFKSLDKALDICSRHNDCNGVTMTEGVYQLRSNPKVDPSPSGEKSYLKLASSSACLKAGRYKDEREIIAPPPLDFWEPPPGRDVDEVTAKSYINGQPTIFISIASYRDPMCHITIGNALRWAKYPERLMFGVVQQNADVDEPCDYTDVPCSENPEQLLCKYRGNIKIDMVPARAAAGPTFGRHRADRMYRGEYYALQIDAHMYFVDEWDELIIEQHKSTGNDYAILTTYPSDSTNAIDELGHSKIQTTPAICKSAFLGDGLIRHGAAGEFWPVKEVGESPILEAWWAAGISFSRGHKIYRVPNDCCTPMTFNGEEFSMAFRQWTSGYDHYTFRHSVAFHPYNRPKKPPLFWENEKGSHTMDASRSARRYQELFGMELTMPNLDFDRTDMDKYGLGHARPLSKFLRVFGIDFKKRTVRDNCDATLSCRMHLALTKYLRKDGKGIDYTRVPDTIGDNGFRAGNGIFWLDLRSIHGFQLMLNLQFMHCIFTLNSSSVHNEAPFVSLLHEEKKSLTLCCQSKKKCDDKSQMNNFLWIHSEITTEFVAIQHKRVPL